MKFGSDSLNTHMYGYPPLSSPLPPSSNPQPSCSFNNFNSTYSMNFEEVERNPKSMGSDLQNYQKLGFPNVAALGCGATEPFTYISEGSREEKHRNEGCSWRCWGNKDDNLRIKSNLNSKRKFGEVHRNATHSRHRWAPDEDIFLIELVEKFGDGKWSEIATEMKSREPNQCRERWRNHLHPDIKKGNWTEEEDYILHEAQINLGNSWVQIAKMLPGRSENSVKNRWNGSKRKKVSQNNLQPSSKVTGSPKFIKGLKEVDIMSAKAYEVENVTNIDMSLVANDIPISSLLTDDDFVFLDYCFERLEVFKEMMSNI